MLADLVCGRCRTQIYSWDKFFTYLSPLRVCFKHCSIKVLLDRSTLHPREEELVQVLVLGNAGILALLLGVPGEGVHLSPQDQLASHQEQLGRAQTIILQM